MAVEQNKNDVSASMTPVLIIIPCYNEEKSIAEVIRSVRELGADFHPLVVDDGSVDRSFAIASALGPCLHLSSNLGIGGAVQAGIRYAKEHRYPLCAQIDGDGQHIASELLRLIEAMRQNAADLVVGSRYLVKKGFQSTFLRRLGAGIIARTLKLAFAVTVTDPTSGLRLMNRRCIDLFSRNYPYDYPEPVSLAMALSAGHKIAEVEAVMRERAQGVSSIGGLKTVGYMIRVISFILIARCKRS